MDAYRVRRNAVALTLGVATSAGLVATAEAARAPLAGMVTRVGDRSIADAAPTTLVLEASALALLAGLAWALILLLAGLTEACTGAAPRLLRVLAPAAGRRAVALACGVALGPAAVALPAHAVHEGAPCPVPGDAPASSPANAVLPVAGLPLPERPTGPAGRRTGGHSDTHGATRARATVTVRPGDSLWELASAQLPSRATLAQRDQAWRALYAANRSRVGPDPHLVHPGTTLRIPQALGDLPQDS